MTGSTGSRGPALGADVAATFREMWTTRPHRRRSEAKLTGVAAAIARRYHLDPVLVRVGFVVLAFYGIGFALYLAGWLVLPPDEDDPPRRAPHPVLLVLLVIAAVGTGGAIVGGNPKTLAGLVVAALLLYLLHRHRGALGCTSTTAASNTPTPASNTPTAASNTPEGPPAWDPLGAAPFAWDLPEPGPESGSEPLARPAAARSVLTAVTLGLALLAGGVSGALLLAGGNLGGLHTVLGAVLGVIGLGLVVGAFLHRGRGLIPVAIPLMLLTYGVSAAPFGGYHNQTWEPTAASLQRTYQLSAGNATLDLRHLDLRNAGSAQTAVQLGAGNVTVLLPPDADVNVHCHSGIGRVDCLGQADGGPGAERRSLDVGSDGRGGGNLELDVSVGAGTVEVRRG